MTSTYSPYEALQLTALLAVKVHGFLKAKFWAVLNKCELTKGAQKEESK